MNGCFCRFSAKNYLVAAWLEPILSAAYADLAGFGPSPTGAVGVYIRLQADSAAAPRPGGS